MICINIFNNYKCSQENNINMTKHTRKAQKILRQIIMRRLMLTKNLKNMQKNN